MAYSEHFLKRKQTYERGMTALKDGAILSLMASSATFLPVFIPLIISVILGLKTARRATESFKTMHPAPLDSRYLPTEIEDLKIQDNILLGLGMELGEYQDWSAFTEDKLQRGFSRSEVTDYLIDMLPKFSPVTLIDDLLRKHLAYSAQTGSGKSELMFATAEQQIARGGPLIIFEAKGKEGDVGASEKIAALCAQHGRIADFQYFSLDDSENCHSWNPWVCKDARSLISMAMALSPSDGDRYFRDMNKYGLTAAILALRYQKRSAPFCFKDLMAIFSDAKILIKLHKTMSDVGEDARTARIYVGHVLNFFMTERNNKKQFNTEMYQSRFAGLAATIGNFCHSEYSKIINSLKPDINITESIEKNKITIISVSSLTDPEGVSILGQIFMADVSRAIGEILKSGNKPIVPAVLWLDEYPSFKATSHQTLFQLVRAANIGVVISFQGINFLKEESETFARNVMGNTWNIMFSDIKDDETRTLAADLSNTVIRMFKMQTSAKSSGASFGSEGSGINHTKSDSFSVSTGHKAVRETLIQPEDLFLDAGDSILIGKTQTIRLRMPYVEFQMPIPTMSEHELVRFDDRSESGDDLWSRESNTDFTQLVQ